MQQQNIFSFKWHVERAQTFKTEQVDVGSPAWCTPPGWTWGGTLHRPGSHSPHTVATHEGEEGRVNTCAVTQPITHPSQRRLQSASESNPTYCDFASTNEDRTTLLENDPIHDISEIVFPKTPGLGWNLRVQSCIIREHIFMLLKYSLHVCCRIFKGEYIF